MRSDEVDAPRVRISDPQRVLRQLSAPALRRMQQRVVIAMTCSDPTLLSSTSRQQVSTQPWRPRCSTSSLGSSKSSGRASSSSATTSRSSRECASARRRPLRHASSRKGDPERSSRTPATRTRSDFSGASRAGGLRKDAQRLDTLPGFLPQLGAELPGCVFADRCGLVRTICREQEPAFHSLGDGHASRCHFHDEAQSLLARRRRRRRSQGRTAPLLRVEHMGKTSARRATRSARCQTSRSRSARGRLSGESGSGKTTLARLLLGLTAPDGGSGTLELDGGRFPAPDSRSGATTTSGRSRSSSRSRPGALPAFRAAHPGPCG